MRVTQSAQSASPPGKIWIDLDNSPHVPLFKPIVDEFVRQEYEVVLTARDCFQVPELVEKLQLHCAFIGRHYGKNKVLKVLGTGVRALQMHHFVKRERPTLALSHGSRSQLLAATMLRIPAVLMMDYEHIQTIPGIRPAMIVMPEVLESWARQSLAVRQPATTLIRFYPGIKEDVYVPQFRPDPQLLVDLQISPHDLLVTIRPPATEAHYHNPESENLFAETLNHIGSFEHVTMVLLPRTPKQAEEIAARWPAWVRDRKIVIPPYAVDGLNLIWFSDLVISGGGTMNREAAALGVPVYSIFRGTLGAVDEYLSRAGRLTILQSTADAKKRLQLVRREKTGLPKHATRQVLENIVEQVIALDRTLRAGKAPVQGQ